MVFLLNSEIHDSRIQVHGSREIYRVVVAAFLERGPDTVKLGHGGNLSRRRDAADLRNAKSDEVYETFGDERHILRRAGQLFVRGLRSDGRLPQRTVPLDLFQVEHVFQKEEP